MADNPLPRHQHHGTPDDELARKEPPEEVREKVDEATQRPNYYREVGLKEGQGNQVLPDIDRTDAVDTSDAGEHQPEGPGGKGI